MKPIDRLNERLSDARRLLEIHEEATGAAAGRRRNVDVLNRSAMILAMAAWEGFCEEIVSVHATRISRKLKNKEDLPQSIRTPFMYWFHDKYDLDKLTNETKLRMWEIAGSGWRKEFRSYIERKVDDLNTPNFKNIKQLMFQVLGIRDFGSNWIQGRHSPDHYRSRLNETLDVRHRIAHGAHNNATVGKKTAKDAIALVERLARWTTAQVESNEADLDLSETELG